MDHWLAPGLGNNAPQTLNGIVSPAILGNEFIHLSSTYTLNSNYQASLWSLTIGDSEGRFNITSSNTTLATVSATERNDGKNHYAFLEATISGRVFWKTVTMTAVIGPSIVCPTATYYVNSGEIPNMWVTNYDFIATAIDDGAGAFVALRGGGSPQGEYGGVVAVMDDKVLQADFQACNIPHFKSAPNNVDPNVSVYPVPASNILNIEIDGSNAATQTLEYDIRLFNIMGTLLRHTRSAGEKVEFNVANLPNGVYYLHIYDGVSSKPVMQQIIVEH